MTTAIAKRPSEKQRELLHALASRAPNYVKPIDLGSWDASYHSGVLRRLVRLGLAEKKVAGGWVCRTHWAYRISEKGKKVVNSKEWRRDD